MKRLKQIPILILLLCAACIKNGGEEQALHQALDAAGTNRPELEKVLAHYNQPQDSLKYRAAVFLISNMPGKYGQYYTVYDRFKPVFDTLESIKAMPYTATYFHYYNDYLVTVLDRFFPGDNIPQVDSGMQIKQDLQVITASYLIENIDYAFKAWELPWAKRIPFDTFCETILPYRYGHEALQPWRKQYYETELARLKDQMNESDPVKVAYFLNQLHKQSFSEIARLRLLNNAIKPLDLIRINTSTTCQDQSGLGLLRMRGLGIPATRLVVPLWANRGSGHDLNAVLSQDGKWIPFQNGEGSPGEYKVPGFFKLAKIYTEIYANKGSESFVSNETAMKRAAEYVDVTSQITEVSDITLPAGDIKGRWGYLCVFNNSDWVPVMKTAIKDGKLQFDQVGRDIIYMIGQEENGKVKVAGNPLMVEKDGSQHTLDPGATTTELVLRRKYPQNDFLMDWVHNLNGISVQAGDDGEHFPVTLAKVDSFKTLHTQTFHTAGNAYQYVRLFFPVGIDNNIESFAGFDVFTNNGHRITKQVGEPFSNIPASPSFYKTIFDANPLTFVKLLANDFADFPQYYNGNSLVVPRHKPVWFGMKFPGKVAISEVSISPRSDDNDINPAESYELSYWQDGWHSLGIREAATDSLHYRGPANALYLLRNINRGVESRIFLWKDDQQQWY